MRRAGWYDALIWLLFALIGFLAPLVSGILVLAALGEAVTLEFFTSGGQFAVSSAGLLMTTTYFVARPSSISRLRLTEWFTLFSISGLVLGIVLFSLATLALSGFAINSSFYQLPSVFLFAIALFVAFVAVGLDREREIEDSGYLERNIKVARTKIEEDFDATS